VSLWDCFASKFCEIDTKSADLDISVHTPSKCSLEKPHLLLGFSFVATIEKTFSLNPGKHLSTMSTKQDAPLEVVKAILDE
jgi:hypothetical protein